MRLISILFSLMVAVQSASAYEFTRTVLVKQDGASDSYMAFQSILEHGRYTIMACAAPRAEEYFSHTRALELTDCRFIGRIDGYGKEELAARIHQLKKSANQQWWIDNSSKVVAGGVGAFLGAVTGMAYGVRYESSVPALFSLAGAASGGASGILLVDYLMVGNESAQANLLEQAGFSPFSDGSVIVLKGSDFKAVADSLNETLLGIEEDLFR